MKKISVREARNLGLSLSTSDGTPGGKITRRNINDIRRAIAESNAPADVIRKIMVPTRKAA